MVKHENEYRHNATWPYHISSGGVVYRVSDAGALEAAVLVRIRPDGTTYHLPKGTLLQNETLEDCCQREVAEESGLIGEIKGYLGALTHEYTRNNIEISKTTHYFAIRWQSSLDEIDDEHDGVEWHSFSEVSRLFQQTEPRKQEALIIERLIAFSEKFEI